MLVFAKLGMRIMKPEEVVEGVESEEVSYMSQEVQREELNRHGQEVCDEGKLLKHLRTKGQSSHRGRSRLME